MRILHVIATLGPGGAETFAASLTGTMSEQGHNVALFLLAGVRGERGLYLEKNLSDKKVAVFGREERKPGSLFNVLKLAKTILSFKPDVVHAHLPSGEIISAIASRLLLLPKKNLFRTLHSSNMIIDYRYSKAIRMMDRFFGGTIACGEAVYASYARMHRGCFSTKMFVINNGALFQGCSYSRSDIREKMQICSGEYVLVNIAAFRGESLKRSAKAHDILLCAFSRFLQVVPDAILLLIGDGPLLSEAKELAKKLGVEKKVRFLGVIASPMSCLVAADLYFMPSRYEGLPISLLEAASVGLPAVTSNIPELTNLNEGFPWLHADVDDVDGFCEALLRSYRRKSNEPSASYVDVIRNKYGILSCAEKYTDAYMKLIGEERV